MRLSKHLQSCFLSVYILKSAISIGTIVTTIIGISLLYVLVYAFIISSVTAQIESSFRNFFIIIFFLSSVLMIISSIAAIYGTLFGLYKIGLLRKKNKFLVIYAITMGIYFASFVTLGIFSTDFPNQLRDQCTMNPQQSSSFQVAINQANRTLCKKQCECYFPHFYDSYTIEQQQIMTKMGITNISINDSSLPVNAQNCKTWSNYTYPITSQMLMIQTFFNCAGWCNINPQYNLYYLFSNLNHGIPQKSCVDAFVQFFNKFGFILQLSSFIVSGILFLILMNILCLCFHPQKSRQYDALKFFRETLVYKNGNIRKNKESQSDIFKLQE